ncbi:MAG: hypothetical protein Q7R47_00380 [Candidatus Diapherotrites archaeon]|nr:hypothetical protein [Candidatus Diapherotrites archaeon]
MKSELIHGTLATVGFLLSPLSWWNDLVVNIPLAYAAASLVAVLGKSLFLPAFVLAYWATNVLGILLLHKGANGLAKKEYDPFSKNELMKTLAWTTAYTILIAGLVWTGILRFPTEYLQ